MTNVVPPALEGRFLEPPGWRWHYLTNAQGKKLRFGAAYPESRLPDAVTVILPGRTEYAEKYFETARALLDKNLSVWILEWQGQGLSDRFIPRFPQRGHSLSFERHADDLHGFILEYVKHACVRPDVGRIPMVMLAHSMGANIGLRFLHKYPGMFESAALCSPMLGIPAIDRIPAASLVTLLMSVFAGTSYAFGQKDWSETEDTAQAYSSDPMRSLIHHAWLRENPALRSGGATFCWIYHAFNSCLFLQQPTVLKSIQTPCLVALAGQETLVDNAAIRTAAEILPHAKLLELPESRHEILMERDEIRNEFLGAFMLLIKETVLDRPETLKTF